MVTNPCSGGNIRQRSINDPSRVKFIQPQTVPKVVDAQRNTEQDEQTYHQSSRRW